METSKALEALGALSQETRLAVYRLLVEHAPEGLPAGEIALKLDIVPASLSFHLKALSHAGLVATKQDGRFVWYRADLAAMNALVGYLTENCCRSGVACDPSCAPGPAAASVAASPRVLKGAGALRRKPNAGKTSARIPADATRPSIRRRGA